MLVIPTWVADNSYVPPPWMVCHSIFGLFVLKYWQIDLHPNSPSWPCWSVSFPWHPCHGWLPGTLIPFPIGTPTPRRGLTTLSVSRKSWSSLPSEPPTTSASMLRMSVSLLRPVFNGIAISSLPLGSILFHTLHPLFDIIYSSWYPGPPDLSSLFYNSVQNDSVTLLYSISWSPLPEMSYQPSWWDWSG